MKCVACDGTGKQKRSMLVGDKMTIWYSPVAKCLTCKGTGEAKNHESLRMPLRMLFSRIVRNQRQKPQSVEHEGISVRRSLRTSQNQGVNYIIPESVCC